MMRTITVVSSDTQNRVSFETEATTVAELLTELDNRGIDYEGKSLFEGISKSEFNVNNGEGILPHDLPWKGQVTNNLVIMLTPARKKISSGIDRNAVLHEIKERGLAEEVKEKYGKNYSNLPTDTLVEFLSAKEEDDNDEPENENEGKETCPACSFLATMVYHAIKTGVLPGQVVAEMLVDLGYVTKEDVTLPEDEVECPYTEDELESMFNFAE